jgi:hypothetical protein
MAFDWKSFFRYIHLALFCRRGEHYRRTPRRLVQLAIACATYPFFEAGIWTGYLLDEILFRKYRRQKIKQPVFIVGNPRSGTTFLYNVMAADTRNFTCTHTWETVLAPSVTARKAYNLMGALDRRLGNPLQRQVSEGEKRLHKEVAMHKFRLRQPEEDEHFLVHTCSAIELWLFTALMEGAVPLTYFDSMPTAPDRARIMDYYVRCVQRHLYAHQADRQPGLRYLAKNPYSSAKIGSLYECFPDARFIYLARNPLDMIPSWVNSVALGWRISGGTPDPYGSRDFVLDLAEHWYRYPLECFERAPKNSYIVVKFDDLVSDIQGTVRDIYDRFGLEPSEKLERAARAAADASRRYQSKHKYSLKKIGLSRERIVERLGDIFERFGFDTREPVSANKAQAPQASRR